MATNDFQVFSGASGANVITQQQYLSLQALPQGFSTGIAQSNQVNKVWRQASIIAAMIGQFIADKSGQNATDDGTTATLEQNFIAALQVVGRIKLTGNLSLFVSASGSDNNNGLSAASPFATIQKAWTYIITSLDLANFTVTVNVANGTYTTGIACLGSPLGFGAQSVVRFVGNVSSPGACIITTANQHAIQAIGGAPIRISGFTLTTSGSVAGVASIGCLSSGSGSNITIEGNMNFGTCAGPHMWAAGGGIALNSSYAVSGGAAEHYSSSGGGAIQANVAGTVTLSGTPAFPNGFAFAFQLGVIQIFSSLFNYSGTATGLRYQVATNSVINTNSSGPTYFPGSIAGTTNTGGQYT